MIIGVADNGAVVVTLEVGDVLPRVWIKPRCNVVLKMPTGVVHGPELTQGKEADSNVHELRAAPDLQVAGPYELAEEAICSHIPAHDPYDEACDDRYPQSPESQ